MQYDEQLRFNCHGNHPPQQPFIYNQPQQQQQNNWSPALSVYPTHNNNNYNSSYHQNNFIYPTPPIQQRSTIPSSTPISSNTTANHGFTGHHPPYSNIYSNVQGMNTVYHNGNMRNPPTILGQSQNFHYNQQASSFNTIYQHHHGNNNNNIRILSPADFIARPAAMNANTNNSINNTTNNQCPFPLQQQPQSSFSQGQIGQNTTYTMPQQMHPSLNQSFVLPQQQQYYPPVGSQVYIPPMQHPPQQQQQQPVPYSTANPLRSCFDPTYPYNASIPTSQHQFLSPQLNFASSEFAPSIQSEQILETEKIVEAIAVKEEPLPKEEVEEKAITKNPSSPTEVKRLKRKYDRRVPLIDNEGHIVRVSVPRIVKSDIRRQYLSMLTNVFNSCDFPFMYSFIHTFAAPDVMLMKQNLFLNQLRRNNSNQGNFRLMESGESVEDVAENFAPSQLKHWPPYQKGFGPHKPPEDYKPMVPGQCDQGLCVIGRSLVTYYWMSLLQIIPDQVIKFEEVKVVTRYGTNECYIVCKFVVRGVLVYDIAFNQIAEDLVDAFAKKCSLKRKDKEDPNASSDNQTTRQNSIPQEYERVEKKKRKIGIDGEESDSDATVSSSATSTTKSSNASSSSSSAFSFDTPSLSSGDFSFTVENVNQECEAEEEDAVKTARDDDDSDDDKRRNVETMAEKSSSGRYDSYNIHEEDFVSALSFGGEQKASHPKDPSKYHDPIATRWKQSRQPVALKDSTVAVQGLFYIHINEDRQIRAMDFRMAFPSASSFTTSSSAVDSSKADSTGSSSG